MILEISEALELRQAGGDGLLDRRRIALYLAHQHAKRFRAIIGLEAPPSGTLLRCRVAAPPDVHGGECRPRGVGAGGADRARTTTAGRRCGIICKAGPGFSKGDLHFYNGRRRYPRKIDEIDGKAANLHLLTGEYDYSCTTEGTLDIAKRTGASATIMKGLGHFR